jgi:hypothetical protein
MLHMRSLAIGLPLMLPTAQAFLRHIARTLEAAMHAGQESGAKRHQRVFSVQLVRGCPFYGYHPGERLFMKIIM